MTWPLVGAVWASSPSERELARTLLARVAVEIADERGAYVHFAEQERIDASAARVALGTIDAVPVGAALVRIVDLRSGRLGVIDAFAVELEAREVGVGEAIVSLVARYCLDQGCMGIDATALPGARLTKNFFESFGFTARRLVVHKSLTPGEDKFFERGE